MPFTVNEDALELQNRLPIKETELIIQEDLERDDKLLLFTVQNIERDLNIGLPLKCARLVLRVL
jgi:hypothetical protein